MANDFFGTGPQTTSSTTNLGFATPYIDRLMFGGESVAQTPFTPYGGQRVAQASPLQTQAFTQASQMGQPTPYQQSSDLFGKASQTGQGLASFTPSNFSYEKFGAPQAQEYMSPYQQSVTDIQKREADRAFEQQQNRLRMNAAARGAFGGSRATLLESEGRRNQNQLLDDIQQKGLAAAFQNAQQQFTADRTQRFSVEQAREQARQQAANLLLQGNQQVISSAQGLAGLGSQQSASDIARINQLADLGNQMRGIQQGGLDVDYQNFLEQREYQKNQLNFLKNLYSGMPLGTQSTTTEPGANLINQLLSTGLGGLSIYKILSGLG